MDARSVRLVDMLKGWQYLMCLQQISLFLCISIASSILYQCSCHPLRGLHPSCDGKGCSVPPTLSSFHPTSHLPTPPPSNSSLFIQTNREWCQESISGEVPNAESYLLPSSSPANQGSTFNSFNPKWTIAAGFFSLITFRRGAGQAGVKRSKVSLAMQAGPHHPLAEQIIQFMESVGSGFKENPQDAFQGTVPLPWKWATWGKPHLVWGGSAQRGVRMERNCCRRTGRVRQGSLRHTSAESSRLSLCFLP